MKTLPKTKSESDHQGAHQQPQPEPVTWHKAVPPRIEGRRDDGERDPMLATDEWRPGEAAKRGYEKAVEDWWWL
jgi:hypothetical protein